jgi:mannose-6-phosphate isomerase-like protein (cupin superfamily)
MVKNFQSPDERRPFISKGMSEILEFEGRSVMRAVFEPGWRWSEHVKPLAGTEQCESAHAGFVVSGRMHIRMSDGEEAEIGPGDVVEVPPGHDAWVVGDQPCVLIDFGAVESYAERQRRPPLQEEVPAPH